MVAIAATGCDSRVAGAREQGAPARSDSYSQDSAAARKAARSRGRTARPYVDRDLEPIVAIDPIANEALCVTKGELATPSFDSSETRGSRVDVPTFRAVALDRGGDAAAMRFVVHGTTLQGRALASGQARRQLGLKLRAQNGCNLVYVMWRLDPKPKLEVSVKRNEGQRTAKECGAGGYTKVKPLYTELPAILDDGSEHELRAEINGDELTAWIDGTVAWQGTLPKAARDLSGPAGVRSDNLAFELVGFAPDTRTSATEIKAKCVADETSD